jgi:hypothetical protein
MKAFTLSALFGLSSLATAQTRGRGKFCGNTGLPVPPWINPVLTEVSNGSYSFGNAQQQATTVVNTYVHLVGRNNTINSVAESRVFATIQSLNDGFRQAGFQFNLAGFDSKVDPQRVFDLNQVRELRE